MLITFYNTRHKQCLCMQNVTQQNNQNIHSFFVAMMLKAVGGKLWKKKNISTWYTHYHADITKKTHHFTKSSSSYRNFKKSWRKSEVLNFYTTQSVFMSLKLLLERRIHGLNCWKYKVGDCAPLNVIKWNFYEAFELIKVFTFWHKNEHLMFPFPLFITTHWLSQWWWD